MTGEDNPDGRLLCWVLTGPTASGKSAVAMELARRHRIEIVSVDSMQVYRGMDIGTAKPSPDQLAAVPHHMIDVFDPAETCNVARFCGMAEQAIAGIRSRGKRPLLVGGAPMYLKGLLWGLMPAPGRDPELRKRLAGELRALGPAALHRRLEACDPTAARRIHPNDVQRLTRALEYCELTGRRISDGQREFTGPTRLPHLMVGLRRGREDLYRRAERRVDRMLAHGLVAEVAGLQGRLGPQAGQALGYKELMDHVAGLAPLEDAILLIKRRTRRYAKHQLTWFRHFPQLRWVDVSPGESASEVALRCERLLGTSA